MIKIFDTTLRDGEQSPGCSMNLTEKRRLARQLETLGVDIIEAGFAASSPGDFEAVKEIANTVTKPIVLSLARCLKSDIDKAVEAVKDAKHPGIHVFIATSPLHMQHKLRMTEDQVYEKAVESVAYAKQFIDHVEFSCEDYSRSEPEFVYRVLEGAIAAGATVVNLPDTVGYMMPQEYYEMIKGVKDNVKGINNVDISTHCHNDLGLAVANSLAAVLAGATQVECSINGIGERAGNAALEEIVMALDTRRDYYGSGTNVNTTEIFRTSELLSSIIGQEISPTKPIVGANVFAHESGIHQHGVLMEKSTYEIMTPQSVGVKQSTNLVLGKHSGKHAFRAKLEDLGYDFDEVKLEDLFGKFKELADKKKNIYEDDIIALASENMARFIEDYKLLDYSSQSYSNKKSTTFIALEYKGDRVEATATEDGPISAAFRALQDIIGEDIRLDDFKIRSVTEGRDALGETTLRLNYKDKIFFGKGLSTDIIKSSILAYINGLNNVAYYKEKGHPAK